MKQSTAVQLTFVNSNSALHSVFFFYKVMTKSKIMKNYPICVARLRYMVPVEYFQRCDLTASLGWHIKTRISSFIMPLPNIGCLRNMAKKEKEKRITCLVNLLLLKLISLKIGTCEKLNKILKCMII